MLVLTVFRLLSTTDAAAVFLFASARSRSSMVSCAALATSGFFLESRHPIATMSARQRAADNTESVFMYSPGVKAVRLEGQRPCQSGASEDMQLTRH